MTTDVIFPATAMPDTDWWTALWHDPDGVLWKLGIRPGQAALDLCCGDGHFILPLCHMVGTRGRVTGLDMDAELLKLAKARTGGLECTWIEGDACRVDELIADPLDVVLMANTFHGVPDKQGLAHAVARALKPEGRFIIINWHAVPREETPVLGQLRGPPTEMRVSPDEVSSLVAPAGFELDQVIELPPYHYGAVFRLAKHRSGV